MTLLTGALVSVVEWLLSKLGVEIFDWIKNYRALEAVKAKALADSKNLAAAKTPQEQGDALQKSIDNTFGSNP